MVNERTGEVHDYRRRSGVAYTEAFAPAGVAPIPSAILWNRAEAAETRKNANVAREVLVALPHELDQVQRRDLAKAIAQDLANRYGTAGTLAIHLPDKEGDQRNHHVHILMTTRRVDAEGTFGEKTRELDDLKRRGPLEVEWIREMIETRTNHALEQAGSENRVDRRSLAQQQRAALAAGDQLRADQLDRPATVHEGPRVTQIRREAARAGRAPLGVLDRAAVNDDIHQLVAERKELARVSAQILDFETARLAREQMDAFRAGPKLVKPFKSQSTLHHLDKATVLAQLTTEVQADQTVLYRLNRDAAFTDTGQQRLQMQPGAGQSDEKVVAALLTAVEQYKGSIELTGSDAFKAKAIGLIVRHRIDVTMKTFEQQVMLNKARLDDIFNTPALDHEQRVSAELGRFGAEVERIKQAASKPTEKVATLDLEAEFSAIRAMRDGVRETQDAMKRWEQEQARIEQEKQATILREEQRRIDAWNQQRRYEESLRQQLEADRQTRQPKWKPPSPG